MLSNRIVARLSREQAEQFRAICAENDTTPSELIRKLVELATGNKGGAGKVCALLDRLDQRPAKRRGSIDLRLNAIESSIKRLSARASAPGRVH